MTETVSSALVAEAPGTARTLKIEEEGDPFRGLVKPKIRLMGRWLEAAGFAPGQRVRVTCLAPGLLELRCAEPAVLHDAPAAEKPDCPF